MDDFDRKLLDLVQDNNLLTAETLSAAVGLSPSACQRRLKRLRQEGVIVGDVAVLAPAAVGRHLTMIVEVVLERERPDLVDSFKRSMQRTPEVMQCYYVTGDVDFVLILTVPDMKDYEDFTCRFFLDNPNVLRFNTTVVMDRVKASLRLPL